jgi:Zn-dependent peptidase ImmA (M78 family)
LYDIATVLGLQPAALLPPFSNQAEVREIYLKSLSLGEREWVKSILGTLPGRESQGPSADRKVVIEKNPEAILRKLEVDAPPVPVDHVAQQCGAELRYAPYEGEMSGLLLNDGERIIIGLNSRDAKVRQRFAIAHELGHLALHGDKKLHVDRTFSSVRGRGASIRTDPVESSANDFAIGLLVPPSMITSDLKGKKLDYSNGEMLGGLAERYKVGLEVMTYRLMKLNALTVS